MKKLDDIDPGHYEARLSGLLVYDSLASSRTLYYVHVKRLSRGLSTLVLQWILLCWRSPDPYDNQKVNTQRGSKRGERGGLRQ